MKKTAVDFLKEKLTYVFVHDKSFNELFKQAKAMEKEQMKNACIQHQYENKAFQKLLEKQFEQYYNETFKSE